MMIKTKTNCRLLHFSKAVVLCCVMLAGSVSAQQDSTDFINEIDSIDFRRGEQGEGKVLVFLQQSSAAVDVVEQNGRIQLDFHDTKISDELLYQLDVLDFATVVKGIETFREGDKARLVIETLDSFSYSYQQIDQIFHLVVQKRSDEQTKSAAAGQYVGRAISLNFQDIPVRTVLQIIADYNGFNLVTSDSVTGNITLRLDGTPWDQALDLVLRTTVVFALILVVTRAVGRRELSSMEPFDLILLVVIGDLVQQGVTQSDYSMTGTLIVLSTLAMLVAKAVAGLEKNTGEGRRAARLKLLQRQSANRHHLYPPFRLRARRRCAGW